MARVRAKATRQALAFITNQKLRYMKAGMDAAEALTKARLDSMLPAGGDSRRAGSMPQSYFQVISLARQELRNIHNGALDHQAEFDVHIIAMRKLAEATDDVETAAKILRDSALLLKEVAIKRLEHQVREE